MKILASDYFTLYPLCNIISIWIEDDELLLAKDIKGNEITLGDYSECSDKLIAKKLLNDIMYWTIDEKSHSYLTPMADCFDENISPQPNQYHYADEEKISKLIEKSTKGPICIKAQNETLYFINNILSLDGYVTEDDTLLKYDISTTTKSYIVARTVDGEEIILGQFRDEFKAHDIIDNLLIDSIPVLIIPQDTNTTE